MLSFISNLVAFAASGVIGLTSMTSEASAQATGFPTAEESDPNVMGWMTGFPPSPELRITNPDSVFFSFPRLRWSVCHLREFLPTEQVSRGIGAPRPMEYALDGNIDDVTFMPIRGEEEMTWEESLSANYTDGILIMHEGRIVYERYFGCLDEAGQHAAMSMTKSFTGILAEILVAEGALDDTALVRDIIPELEVSAFGSATVRQVMDMTTAFEFSEDYGDPNAAIWVYNAAASPFPKPADYDGPEGYFEFLQTVGPDPEGIQHGDEFHYRTPNSDVLGWIISRVSGMEVTELLSERIWSRMGAEQDAYMTVDGLGTPFAGGGLSAGLRDLGRFGQIMLNGGEWFGEQIIPAAAIESVRAGGNLDDFAAAGYTDLAGGSYRGQFWILNNDHGAYAARGVHGQTIYIDPTAEMVIVRFASFPIAFNSRIDPTSLPAYQAVAEYLVAQ